MTNRVESNDRFDDAGRVNRFPPRPALRPTDETKHLENLALEIVLYENDVMQGRLIMFSILAASNVYPQRSISTDNE